MHYKNESSNLLRLLIFVCYGISTICCQCLLKMPDELEARPKYTKYFGKKAIRISYDEKIIYLEDGESISGFCANSFTNIIVQRRHYDYYGNEVPLSLNRREISLVCQGNRLTENENKFIVEDLRCQPPHWTMYESENEFRWCDPSKGSYIFSTNSSKLLFAEACYDLSKVSLQTLHYFIDPQPTTQDHNEMHKITPNNYEEPKFGEEVKTFKYLFPRKTPSNESMDFWENLVNSEYRSASIVQGRQYWKYFVNFGNATEILWWSVLLNGNWKRVMNALDEQANNITYSIYAGTAGIVEIPESQLTSCSLLSVSRTLWYGNARHSLPAYVWTYVQAVDDMDDFVIIGYNSPLYDFYKEQDIIKCKDICDQITWLQDIRSTFRHPALGVIFCCSPKEVRELNFLTGFPPERDIFTSSTPQNLYDFYSTESSDEYVFYTTQSSDQIDENDISRDDSENEDDDY